MNPNIHLRCAAFPAAIAALLAASLAFFFPLTTGAREPTRPVAPKYIFIFIADGGGITHMEITRMFNRHLHNEGLTIVDKIMKEGSVGLLTTHAADSLVTDSSAAATALAWDCSRPMRRILLSPIPPRQPPPWPAAVKQRTARSERAKMALSPRPSWRWPRKRGCASA
ncbi:MAG: alkaline phosphatase [Deltaproteobacteria bacterium]|nr:alkaline phosphatase [Deltaproteobacteria bacterium]